MNKVNIIRKHIGSDDFYDLNGTEMLSKILAAMDEYAEQQVKNLNIPAVINQVCDYRENFGKCLPDCMTDSCKHHRTHK